MGITVQQNITVNIRNTDAQPPTIGVNAISSSADLLDWNGAPLSGHIESAAESLYDNGGTVDADVCGTVMVRGTAHDNVRIDAIALSIDGGAPIQVAHWDTDGLVADIAAFHISSESLSDSGHSVSWDYKWDTAATIASVAKKNVVLSFTAVDPSANSSAAGARQYDVVPYITKVSTHSGGIKDGNIRSASGRYSILQNLVDNSDLITLSGYNLKPITGGVRVSSDPDGLVGTTLQGTALTVESSASPWTTLTVRKNSDRSGYLVVVGGSAGDPVPSLNNINDNARPQNQEPDIYSQNYLLTDDRYLNFFRVTQTGYANGYYPAMVMNGDTPVFAYCNDNTGADLRAGAVIANGWYHRMNALARDGDGNYYQVSVHDAFGNGSYGHLSLFFNAWGGNAWPLGNPGTTGNNNALALDNLTYTAVKLNRFHYPKLLVTGGGALAQVYLLYYDDEPSIKDLIVRVFRIGTSVTGGGTYAMGATRTNQVEAVGDGTAAGRNVVAGSASMFFDAGLTSGGVLVVAYYDEAVNQLRFTYNPNPVNASGLYGGSFSTPLNLDSTYNGSYVSLHVDALDRIHIACYDMADACLLYTSPSPRDS